MVYNTTSQISFPFSRQNMRAINKKLSSNSSNMTGRGGTVLLARGGPGGASSYNGIDDYIQQTKIDPFKRSQQVSSSLSGQGFKGVADKLSKLSLGIKPKLKNIKLSM